MKQKKDLFARFYILIPLLILLVQCRSNQYYLASNKTEVSNQEKGDWVISKRLYVYPEKTYRLQKDGSSKPYPIVVDQKDTTLVVLIVNKNLKKPLPDSGLGLKLYIPTPNPLIFKKKELIIPPKMVIFGLQAFMAGAGYKQLKDGRIKLIRRDGKIILSISLKGRFIEEFNGEYPLPKKKLIYHNVPRGT